MSVLRFAGRVGDIIGQGIPSPWLETEKPINAVFAMGMEGSTPMTVHVPSGENKVVRRSSCRVSGKGQSSPKKSAWAGKHGFWATLPELDGQDGSCLIPAGALAPICMTSLGGSLKRTSPQTGDELAAKRAKASPDDQVAGRQVPPGPGLEPADLCSEFGRAAGPKK
jgi:hypothetical protein